MKQGSSTICVRYGMCLIVDMWEVDWSKLQRDPGYRPVDRGYEGRAIIVARLAGSGRSLLLNGHTDVLPVGNGEGSAGLAALAGGLFAATAAYAEPTVNKGDNAWMRTSTVLVLLMTIPGLALFYGGLVRSKNMPSVLMQVFYTLCILTLLWALYGYSLAFTGGSDFIGGFSKAFLMGVTPDSKAATFSVDANISELVYVCFQMTFAAITPA